jgi:hypothetical protein
MRIRGIALLSLVLALAMPAVAQEQRASIEGVVKDASGAVLPGVTVQAKNVGVGSAVSAVTDASGSYRFPALAPGTYEVTATLQGFNVAKMSDVLLSLGQIKNVDLALAIAGVAESVQVSAESPLVDVKQSARATSIRDEQIDLLPKGRDFTSLVTQAPGANNESKSGGVMIDGATTSENRYIVDGAEVNDLVSGASGKAVLPDFIQEVQVKSSGYAAEYGGAMGGVVNVITKSGSNTWRGNVLFYFENSSIGGNPQDTTYSIGLKTLRLTPANANKAEYVTYGKDDYSRYEPGFSVGGPLARNKAWFYVAYQPTVREYSRSVTATFDGSTESATRKRPVQYLSVNETMQLTSNFRTRVAYNNSKGRTDGYLPSLDGSDYPGTKYAGMGTDYPNSSLSAQADWVIKPNSFLGVRVGYYKSDVKSFGVPDSSRFIYRTSALNCTAPGSCWASNPGMPSSAAAGTSFQNTLTNTVTDFDSQERLTFQVDNTWYVSAGGQHAIKGGLQIDHLANDVNQFEAGPYGQVYWGLTYRGVTGPYGYIRFRNNFSDPQRGFETTGNVSTTNYGLFIQDAWSVNRRLTVNLGLRTENETVLPYAGTYQGTTLPTIKWSMADKLAPRLGFAWDIKGDGKWKAYGSWGIFYDIFKLNLGRGSFGGEKWIEYWYALNTSDIGKALNSVGSVCTPECPSVWPDSSLLGKRARGPYDYRLPGEMDPAVKPMELQELSFGFEHQLAADMAVSARYIRKKLIRAVDDTGSFNDTGEIYVIANPGFGATTVAYQPTNTPLPKARRDYDGVELAFSKNFSHNYFLRVSYLWSRLFGNYSGLDQTDENGRQSPNTGRLYDYPIMSFDQHGTEVEGPLATDRPHQVKAQFAYQFKFGTSVGLNQYISSGIPKTSEISWYPGYPMFYNGRGDMGRMPTYSQTDLNLTQQFKLGGSKRIEVSMNVLNLFNQGTATNFFSTFTATSAYANIDEAAVYNHTAPDFEAQVLKDYGANGKDPRYMMDNGWQLPRAVRFGLKFLF